MNLWYYEKVTECYFPSFALKVSSTQLSRDIGEI